MSDELEQLARREADLLAQRERFHASPVALIAARTVATTEKRFQWRLTAGPELGPRSLPAKRVEAILSFAVSIAGAIALITGHIAIPLLALPVVFGSMFGAVAIKRFLIRRLRSLDDEYRRSIRPVHADPCAIERARVGDAELKRETRLNRRALVPVVLGMVGCAGALTWVISLTRHSGWATRNLLVDLSLFAALATMAILYAVVGFAVGRRHGGLDLKHLQQRVERDHLRVAFEPALEVEAEQEDEDDEDDEAFASSARR